MPFCSSTFISNIRKINERVQKQPLLKWYFMAKGVTLTRTHLFISVNILFTLKWRRQRRKWRTGNVFCGNGTGLCLDVSNCCVCFYKECFHSTGCVQLQVKGQCIFYPRRKGNAYIIQSASASHVHWTHSGLVTLYTRILHFKLRHNFLSLHFKFSSPHRILLPFPFE